jgi:hypothetical protein
MSHEKVLYLMKKFIIKIAESPFDITNPLDVTKVEKKRNPKTNPKLDRLANDLSFLEDKFKDLIQSFVKRLPIFIKEHYNDLLSIEMLPKLGIIKKLYEDLQVDISPEEYNKYYDDNFYEIIWLVEYIKNLISSKTKAHNVFAYLIDAKTLGMKIILTKKAIKELSKINI